MKRITTTFTLLLAISGCASAPLAPAEADRAAKTFKTAPGLANLYVYRSEELGAGGVMRLSVDDQDLGQTAPQTYVLVPVAPGVHHVSSLAENTDTLEIKAEAGHNYYVWQEVNFGSTGERTKLRTTLHLMSDKKGMKGVNQCRLAREVQAPASALAAAAVAPAPEQAEPSAPVAAPAAAAPAPVAPTAPAAPAPLYDASAPLPGLPTPVPPPVAQVAPAAAAPAASPAAETPAAIAPPASSPAPATVPVVASAVKMNFGAGMQAHTAAGAALLNRPVAGGNVVAPLATGSAVTLTASATNDSGTWWYVSSSGGSGWLPESALAP